MKTAAAFSPLFHGRKSFCSLWCTRAPSGCAGALKACAPGNRLILRSRAEALHADHAGDQHDDRNDDPLLARRLAGDVKQTLDFMPVRRQHLRAPRTLGEKPPPWKA